MHYSAQFIRNFNQNTILNCKIEQNELFITVKLQNNPKLSMLFNNMNLSNEIRKYFGDIQSMYIQLQSDNLQTIIKESNSICLIMNNQEFQTKLKLITKNKNLKNSSDINSMYHLQTINCTEFVVKYGESCQIIMNQLKAMPYLTNLIVQWNPLGKKQWIIYILHNLLQLTQLSFNCPENQFDHQCVIEAIKMPKLQKLYYGMNIDKGIQRFSQSVWFKEGKNHIRRNPLRSQVTLNLTQEIKKLHNIWIGKNESILLITSNNKWNHIAIGNSKHQLLSIKSWNCILQLKKLSTIALKKIDKIDNIKLSILIAINSGTLNSLTLFSCNELNELGLINLKQCFKMKYFFLELSSFHPNTFIHGLFLKQLPLLESLYLQQCQAITVNEICKALQQMNNLQYLSLINNQWVNDKVIQQISLIKTIKHLNLYYCRSITNIGFKMIHKLSQISSLHIGLTRISNECIFEIISQLPKIYKIGLWHLQINEQDLKKIGILLQMLTHISVQYCKQINGQSFIDIKLFPCLKYIDSFHSSIDTENIKSQRIDITLIQ